MKTALKPLILLLAVVGSAVCARAQTTAFTYHGRLNNNGGPVTGAYDLLFALYDAEAAGQLVAGPLPVNALGVTDGLFTARLDFGAGVFTGPPRWLEISVRPAGNEDFTTLSPRQELTSSPYSIRAQTAGTAATVSNGSVVTSLNALKDDVTLAAGANVTLTPSGNTLTISSTGTGGNVWSLNGTDAYYTAGNVGVGIDNPNARFHVVSQTAAATDNTATFYAPAIGPFASHIHYGTAGDWFVRSATSSGKVVLQDNGGNVGIGTAAPNHRLRISGGPGWTANGWAGAMEIDNASAIGWRANAAGNRFGIGQSVGGLYFFNTASDPGTTANPANYVMTLSDAGNVGFGTTSPASKLDIAAQDALRIAGFQPFITMSDLNGFGLIRKANRFLQVVDGDLHFSYRPECNVFPCNPETETHMTIRHNGNIGIGTFQPQAKLEVIGTTRTSVLTITGGADIAEPFKMSSPEIPKGSVVVIDEANPGHLKLSTKSYDTRVAGIVSGANGVRPGISLYQEGSIEGGENVALSGRVYVHADAAFGVIQPGDLLTTSETPGHAMKVADHAKAQGAILGKAMSALLEGKGMVLVLVTLQ